MPNLDVSLETILSRLPAKPRQQANEAISELTKAKTHILEVVEKIKQVYNEVTVKGKGLSLRDRFALIIAGGKEIWSVAQNAIQALMSAKSLVQGAYNSMVSTVKGTLESTPQRRLLTQADTSALPDSLSKLLGMITSLEYITSQVQLVSTPLTPGFTIPKTTIALQPDSRFGLFTDGKNPAVLSIAGVIDFASNTFNINASVQSLQLKFGSVAVLNVANLTMNIFREQAVQVTDASNAAKAGAVQVHVAATGSLTATGLGSLVLHRVEGSFLVAEMRMTAFGALVIGSAKLQFFITIRSRLRSKAWARGISQEIGALQTPQRVSRLEEIVAKEGIEVTAGVLKEMPDMTRDETIAALPVSVQAPLT